MSRAEVLGEDHAVARNEIVVDEHASPKPWTPSAVAAPASLDVPTHARRRHSGLVHRPWPSRPPTPACRWRPRSSTVLPESSRLFDARGVARGAHHRAGRLVDLRVGDAVRDGVGLVLHLLLHAVDDAPAPAGAARERAEPAARATVGERQRAWYGRTGVRAIRTWCLSTSEDWCVAWSRAARERGAILGAA